MRHGPLPGLLVAVGLLWSLAAEPARSEHHQRRSTEDDVKAALVLNLTRFVVWPDEAFEHRFTPFRLVVVGSDPLGAALRRAVGGETVHGRRLLVEVVDSLEDPAGVHVVVLAGSSALREDSSLEQLHASRVLTVDSGERRREGAIIALWIVEQRLRFSIDLESARAAGLRLSSHLHGVAEVRPPGATVRAER